MGRKRRKNEYTIKQLEKMLQKDPDNVFAKEALEYKRRYYRNRPNTDVMNCRVPGSYGTGKKK